MDEFRCLDFPDDHHLCDLLLYLCLDKTGSLRMTLLVTFVTIEDNEDNKN